MHCALYMWDVGVDVGGCACDGVRVYFTVPRAGESSPPRSPTGLEYTPRGLVEKGIVAVDG